MKGSDFVSRINGADFVRRTKGGEKAYDYSSRIDAEEELEADRNSKERDEVKFIKSEI